MKACGLITLFTTLMLAVGIFPARAGTDVWVGGSGNWSVANNWNPHHVPGSADIAIITNTGNYTVTLDASIAVAGLTLGATNVGSTQILSFNGQTLTLGGQATVNSGGQFNLSSGTFIGKTNNSGGAVFIGTLTCSGGALVGKLTMSTNGVLNLVGTSASNSLKSLILLTNYGTVNWTNTDLYGAASLQIFNFGLWDAQTSNTFFGNGTIFNSTGTFRKSAGGGTTTLVSGTIFNSSGTVDLQSGTLAVQTGTCSGMFNTASGTILNLGTKTNAFTLTSNTSFTGSGIVEGYLNGNNAMLGGTATFSAATLYGSMTISNTGVANLVGTSNTFGGVLTNYGVVNWSNVDLYGFGSTFIYNYGLWNAQANNSLYGQFGSPIVFNNYGTFRKSSGNGTSTLDTNVDFESSGTLDVESGTLVIADGHGHGSGVFNVANGTFLNFSSGPPYCYAFIGNVNFTGSGIVEGGLGVGSAITLNGTMTFLNGVWDGGGTDPYSGSSLTIASNAVVNLVAGTSFYELRLTNYGIVSWVSGDLHDGDVSLFYNYGLWDAQTNNAFYGNLNPYYGNNTIFNNYGTFRKSGGGGGASTYLDVNTTFNNYGTLDDQVDVIVISGGTGNGVFNNATNAGIYFQSAYILTDNPLFSGGGVLAGYIVGNNATIQGALNLNFGTLSGTLTVASNANLNLGLTPQQPISLQDTILTNYGTVVWNYDDLKCQSSPQIYNYGLWDVQTNNTFYGAYSSSGTTTFNNYGTFRKSGGTVNDNPYATVLDSSTIFNNSGMVDVQSGYLNISSGIGGGVFNTATNTLTGFGSFNNGNFGNYTLAGNTTFTGVGAVSGYVNGNNAVIYGSMNFGGLLSGTLTITSNATINLAGGSFSPLTFNGTTFTNYGTVNWISGDLLGTSAEIYNYGLWDDQTNNFFYGGSGTTFNNYGTFRKSGGTVNDNPYATVLDSSTTFNNPGTLDVQTGLMNLGGSYSLTGGTLNFGINSSNNFGSIELANIEALAGKLSVNLNNNYSPAAGSSFALLSYGSETGTFNALNLPHLSGGLIWQTNYGTMAFTLSVTNPPLPKLSSMTLLNGGTISFGWKGVAGQTYQVQCTTNLAPANWINLGNSIPGTNGTMTVSDVVGLDSQRFYRLVLR